MEFKFIDDFPKSRRGTRITLFSEKYIVWIKDLWWKSKLLHGAWDLKYWLYAHQGIKIWFLSLIYSARYHQSSIFGVDLLNIADFVTNIINLIQIDTKNTICTYNFNTKYENGTANLCSLLEKTCLIWKERNFILFICCCVDNLSCGHFVTLFFGHFWHFKTRYLRSILSDLPKIFFSLFASTCV